MESTGIHGEVQDFQGIFCRRCRHPECTHAKWSSDKFTQRVRTQEERLFNPFQVDPKLPQYAHISQTDFKDLLQEAMRLEIADRRGDWVIPEIPIVDGKPQTSLPGSVDAALKALRKSPVAEDAVPPDDEDEETPAVPNVAPAIVPPRPYPETIPVVRNTPAPRGGVMIGGGNPPPPPPSPKLVVDPWAIPPPGPRKVAPGAVIFMDADEPPKEP